MIQDLLSQYQIGLLDMLFRGDHMQRAKYNVVVCDSMEPLVAAAEYLDHGENENELKQVNCIYIAILDSALPML